MMVPLNNLIKLGTGGTGNNYGEFVGNVNQQAFVNYINNLNDRTIVLKKQYQADYDHKSVLLTEYYDKLMNDRLLVGVKLSDFYIAKGWVRSKGAVTDEWESYNYRQHGRNWFQKLITTDKEPDRYSAPAIVWEKEIDKQIEELKNGADNSNVIRWTYSPTFINCIQLEYLDVNLPNYIRQLTDISSQLQNMAKDVNHVELLDMVVHNSTLSTLTTIANTLENLHHE